MKAWRPMAVVGILSCAALAWAQPKPKPAAPQKVTVTPKPAPKPAGKPAKDAGAEPAAREASPVADGGAATGGKPVHEGKGAGGSKVFRFGELEVEGRLRSPQLVYFLRRVRAEFAAGDLGHRSFMLELSQTRNTESF